MRENSGKTITSGFPRKQGVEQPNVCWRILWRGFGLCSKSMLEFHGLIHVLALLSVTIYHVSGNHKVPTPKKPKLFVFGWPNITSAIASMEMVPVEGVIQYELFYNRTCPFVSFNGSCSSAVTDLSPVDGCHKVENQLSLSSLTSKVLSCTICNSTKECVHMKISKDHDLCFYLRVNTSFGCAHACRERSIQYRIRFPPAKIIQLLATAKKQLTVLWDHPEGIKPKGVEIKYKVLLRDQFAKCFITEKQSGSYMKVSFTNLKPWSKYSVTICGGVLLLCISVNTTACTCGDEYHVPGGPTFNRTLPEEPSEHPSLEPCEAFCDDSNFTVTLKWKASKNLIWNGIPKNSVIRIFNSSSPVPTAVFSVPLEPNYNGSLVMLTISDLTSHLKHIAKLQFCSNGGCGPNITQTLGCDVCESLGVPGTSSGNPSHSQNAESKWPGILAGVSFFVFIVAVIIRTCMVINKKKRKRNRQALRNVIGDLPEIYEESDCTDMTSDDATYNSLESLVLQTNNNKTARWV